jgi:hypothetical protein
VISETVRATALEALTKRAEDLRDKILSYERGDGVSAFKDFLNRQMVEAQAAAAELERINQALKELREK